MTDAVDQPRAVKGLLVQEFLQIRRDLVVILPVADLLLHLLKHLHDL